LTFESRVLSLEQENDSLRLALTIIIQEKSEVDNNQSRVQVEMQNVVKSQRPQIPLKFETVLSRCERM